MRRPQATAESKARAERIARSLAGLLNDLPEVRDGETEDEGSPGGSVGRGARSVASGGALRCPRCAGEMETVANGQGVEIDQCGECGAIWLDTGELETIVARQEPSGDAARNLGELRARMREMLPAAGTVKYRDCPRCAQVMRRTNFGTISGVVVDECVQHGVLLDPGEMQAIEAFVGMGGRTLGEQMRVQQRQRAKPPPPPPPPGGLAGAPGVYYGTSAAETLWDLLFTW